MESLSVAIGYVGGALQLAVLLFLLRGPLSRYFPLFLYVAISLGSTLAEGWAYRLSQARGPLYFTVYWGGEFLLDLLLFFLIYSLAQRALQDTPMQPQVTRLLLLIAGAALILPFFLFEGAAFVSTNWNDRSSQLLTFAAAAMTLILWSSLLMTGRRDIQLLIVSAGLGIAVAGAAVTFGIRRITEEGHFVRQVADVTHRISQLGGLAVWCYAFWPSRQKSPPTAE